MTLDVAYSKADRLLHRMAFASPAIQLTVADIESAALGAAWRNANSSRPVFITSLARAGTTLMLEILHKLPGLACHTYRDMPLVLAPVLWSKLSGRFRSKMDSRERAHGDGVKINFDSPESFEEVFWKSFWPEKYGDSRIDLWREGDEKQEATTFFQEHMKKIVSLRRPEQLAEARYLSKNNTNIARLPLLSQIIPDATVLIVLRDPLEHALSLHTQHMNFMRQQDEDPFVKKYMGDIGHYEFGQLHRPIAFEGLEALTGDLSPETLDYWLAYWIAAFEHIAKTGTNAEIVSYEAVCANGYETLAPVCEKIGLATGGELETATARIRPVQYRADAGNFNPVLVRRAKETHQLLLDN